MDKNTHFGRIFAIMGEIHANMVDNLRTFWSIIYAISQSWGKIRTFLAHFLDHKMGHFAIMGNNYAIFGTQFTQIWGIITLFYDHFLG